MTERQTDGRKEITVSQSLSYFGNTGESQVIVGGRKSTFIDPESRDGGINQRRVHVCRSHFLGLLTRYTYSPCVNGGKESTRERGRIERENERKAQKCRQKSGGFSSENLTGKICLRWRERIT